ncbi:MAG TPA: hypothetical protein VGK58_12545, partial [Lacipirellulaceae bacterium]
MYRIWTLRPIRRKNTALAFLCSLISASLADLSSADSFRLPLAEEDKDAAAFVAVAFSTDGNVLVGFHRTYQGSGDTAQQVFTIWDIPSREIKRRFAIAVRTRPHSDDARAR